MNVSNYHIETLNADHVKQGFSCNVEMLDRYLLHQASQDMRRRIAVVYVITEFNAIQVIGYYTLSASNILLNALPQELVKKLPRYPAVPATLLGRLAIDNKFQGNKLGALLLIDALKRSLELSKKIASMAIIVDAIDSKAKQFYLRFGFTQFLQEENKLFIAMTTVNDMFKKDSKLQLIPSETGV